MITVVELKSGCADNLSRRGERALAAFLENLGLDESNQSVLICYGWDDAKDEVQSLYEHFKDEDELSVETETLFSLIEEFEEDDVEWTRLLPNYSKANNPLFVDAAITSESRRSQHDFASQNQISWDSFTSDPIYTQKIRKENVGRTFQLAEKPDLVKCLEKAVGWGNTVEIVDTHWLEQISGAQGEKVRKEANEFVHAIVKGWAKTSPWTNYGLNLRIVSEAPSGTGRQTIAGWHEQIASDLSRSYFGTSPAPEEPLRLSFYVTHQPEWQDRFMTVIHDLGAKKRMRTWELGHNAKHLGGLLVDPPSILKPGDKQRSLKIHPTFFAAEDELKPSSGYVIPQKEEDTE